MGGSCDTEIQGENADEPMSRWADELMANGKQHVHDQADRGDEGHKAVVEKMIQLSEEEHKKWADDFKQNFDSLEDA